MNAAFLIGLKNSSVAEPSAGCTTHKKNQAKANSEATATDAIRTREPLQERRFQTPRCHDRYHLEREIASNDPNQPSRTECIEIRVSPKGTGSNNECLKRVNIFRPTRVGFLPFIIALLLFSRWASATADQDPNRLALTHHIDSLRTEGGSNFHPDSLLVSPVPLTSFERAVRDYRGGTTPIASHGRPRSNEGTEIARDEGDAGAETDETSREGDFINPSRIPGEDGEGDEVIDDEEDDVQPEIIEDDS